MFSLFFWYVLVTTDSIKLFHLISVSNRIYKSCGQNIELNIGFLLLTSVERFYWVQAWLLVVNKSISYIERKSKEYAFRGRLSILYRRDGRRFVFVNCDLLSINPLDASGWWLDSHNILLIHVFNLCLLLYNQFSLYFFGLVRFIWILK